MKRTWSRLDFLDGCYDEDFHEGDDLLAWVTVRSDIAVRVAYRSFVLYPQLGSVDNQVFNTLEAAKLAVEMML